MSSECKLGSVLEVSGAAWTDGMDVVAWTERNGMSLAITIAVQCENNKAIIEKIQSLTESEQHSLMKVIEQTKAKVKASGDTSTGDASMTECVHIPLYALRAA